MCSSPSSALWLRVLSESLSVAASLVSLLFFTPLPGRYGVKQQASQLQKLTLPLEELKMNTMYVQEGASEADLSILPKYKFQMMNNGEKQTDGGGKMIPIEAGAEYSGNERVLEPEDAVSC